MDRKYLSKFSIIIIYFFSMMSCDPCEDCNAASANEPTVLFVFINQDSIQSIDDSLAVFAFNDSSLTANVDSLDILRDSLQVLNDSIANGGSLLREREVLLEYIGNRQVDSTLFALLNKDSDSLTTIFNQTKSMINSGLLAVEQVEIVGTSFIETYEDIDSALNWSIPLSFDGSFKEYEITIAGEKETIILDYENFQEIDQERNVLIRAKNIQVVNNPYDSLINCEANCLDGETTFTFYF